MIKAIAFDLDHTLFDRYGTLSSVIPEMLEKLPLSYDVEKSATLLCDADKAEICYGWRAVFDRFVREGFFSRKIEFATYKDFLEDAFFRYAAKYPGVEEMLDTLKAEGYKLAIVTNGYHALQARKIEMIGFADKFDLIVISGDTAYRKPAKEIYELTAGKLGVSCKEMAFVGDNPETDIQGAYNAGCPAVWVRTTGVWHVEGLEKPEWQIDSVCEMPALLARVNK